ncbi:helix-turn-helix domain-containing protein [Curtobacterium sp. ISL-83]|uniref:helix-turn-helix domain-containing protein n=1 Tax=Curtobacterium sp. ISL-83 TaxID=2819145 RepID=UPI001BEBC295|nr:helix-turn-helix domain-containing protein [Curtobacterium sp. ISL-83]MBT2504179.1 Hin recombinase [Curtobacterium sp. ISL-83]
MNASARARIAKAAGKHKGRTRKLTDDQITEARGLISTGVPKTTVARGLGIDRTTLYRMLAAPSSLATEGTTAGDVPSL